jgi:hypothetical protein
LTKKSLAFLMIGCFICFLNLYPEKLAVLPEINHPSMMDISGDELFILDDVRVNVYSMKNYRLLRYFWKKGQGPGELHSLPDAPFTMTVNGDRVILSSVYKIIVYKTSGEIFDEIKMSPSFLIEAVPFGSGYVVTKFRRDNGTAVSTTSLCSGKKLKKVKKLFESEIPNSYSKNKIAMPPMVSFARCCENRIFVFGRREDFSIKVFDRQGNPMPDITIPYEKIKSDKVFRQKVDDAISLHPTFKTQPPVFKKIMYVPEQLPVFKDCMVKDGRLYVQTYRSKGNLSEFLIFDTAGEFLKKVYLPGSETLQIRLNPASTFTFSAGKYYYLVENFEKEQWEIHSIDLKDLPS